MNLPELEESGELNDLLDKIAEGEFLLEAGHQIQDAQYLFSRIEDEKIQYQIDKLHKPAMTNPSDNPQSTEAASYHPLKETISYDDFAKIDLRTAKIIAAEKVPKADKLLKLELDLGFETRTVVSGIAQHYQAEEIVGKHILVLANLAPRPLKGIQSNGMILMAENMAGKLTFVSPEGQDTGSIVK